MIDDPNPEKAKRTIEAMLTMTKLDIAALQKAYAGQ
jgi:predicted 3-demethylubiquinone-9 3-methyltransferase (glyoxalase superfamily)